MGILKDELLKLLNPFISITFEDFYLDTKVLRAHQNIEQIALKVTPY